MNRPARNPVQKQIDDANALYEQTYGAKKEGDPAPEGGQTPPEGGEQAAAPQNPGNPAPEGAQTAPEGGNQAPESGEPDYKQQYDTLKGKYDAEVPRINQELQASREMLAALTAEDRQKLTDRLEAGDITDEDREAYGDDLIALIQKGAQAAMRPVVEQLEAENSQLRARLSQTAASLNETSQTQMHAALDNTVPDWREVNQDPNFVAWLQKVDVYSGQKRHDLLTRAYETTDTPRVVAFFTGYKQEQTGTGDAPAKGVPSQSNGRQGLDSLVAPGRPAGSSDAGAPNSEGEWFSERQIAAHEAAKRAGKISRADAAKVDARIHDAVIHGRLNPG